MEANPDFAKSMESIIPGISEFLNTSSLASRSPTVLGWTWHHYEISSICPAYKSTLSEYILS